jgi:hypothetical protein
MLLITFVARRLCPVAALPVYRIAELRPRSPQQQLEEFLASWAAQPLFSLAVHTLSDQELAAAALAGCVPGKQPAGGCSSNAARQRLQGLVVCWEMRHAFYLELSGELVCRDLNLHTLK